MKRPGPRNKLILHNPPLLVGGKRAVLGRELISQFVEPFLHHFCGNRRIAVMHCHLKEAAVEEPRLHRRGGRGGKHPASWGDLQHPQSGLISGDENIEIEGMFGRPSDQLFRGISPLQAEGGLDDFLCGRGLREQYNESGRSPSGENPIRVRSNHSFHAPIIPPSSRFRKQRTLLRGFALIEATLSLSLLSVVGLLLLKLSLNVIHPRQYTLQQVLSDSYMTFERARAERVPFDNLIDGDSPWPAFPDVATETVEIGKMPGGTPVTGTVTRTRVASTENYPIDGGTGTVAVNPAAMKIWRVQSVLNYTIADRTYYKSRTVIRAQ